MPVTSVKYPISDLSPAPSTDPFNVPAGISLVIFRINVVVAHG
jgi:hypothetical protein